MQRDLNGYSWSLLFTFRNCESSINVTWFFQIFCESNAMACRSGKITNFFQNLIILFCAKATSFYRHEILFCATSTWFCRHQNTFWKLCIFFRHKIAFHAIPNLLMLFTMLYHGDTFLLPLSSKNVIFFCYFNTVILHNNFAFIFITNLLYSVFI